MTLDKATASVRDDVYAGVSTTELPGLSDAPLSNALLQLLHDTPVSSILSSESPLESDFVVLVAESGEKVLGLRSILAARSAYFDALLYAPFREQSQRSISVDCSAGKVLQVILDFLVGRVFPSEPDERTGEVLALADAWLLADLTEAIEAQLGQKLCHNFQHRPPCAQCMSGILTTLHLSESQLPLLHQRCARFVETESIRMVPSRHFGQLPALIRERVFSEARTQLACYRTDTVSTYVRWRSVRQRVPTALKADTSRVECAALDAILAGLDTSVRDQSTLTVLLSDEWHADVAVDLLEGIRERLTGVNCLACFTALHRLAHGFTFISDPARTTLTRALATAAHLVLSTVRVRFSEAFTRALEHTPSLLQNLRASLPTDSSYSHFAVIPSVDDMVAAETANPNMERPTTKKSVSRVSRRIIGTRIALVTERHKVRRTGIVRFVGATQFAADVWIGVELDLPFVGRNDGSVNGVRYFSTTREQSGLFVRREAILKQ